MEKFNLKALVSYEIHDYRIDEDIIFKEESNNFFGSDVYEGFYQRKNKFSSHNEWLYEGLPEGRVYLYNDSNSVFHKLDIEIVHIKPCVIMNFGNKYVSYFFNDYQTAKEFEKGFLKSDFVQTLPNIDEL